MDDHQQRRRREDHPKLVSSSVRQMRGRNCIDNTGLRFRALLRELFRISQQPPECNRAPDRSTGNGARKDRESRAGLLSVWVGFDGACALWVGTSPPTPCSRAWGTGYDSHCYCREDRAPEQSSHPPRAYTFPPVTAPITCPLTRATGSGAREYKYWPYSPLPANPRLSRVTLLIFSCRLRPVATFKHPHPAPGWRWPRLTQA